MIFSNDSAKPWIGQGRGLNCFSRSSYLLQVANPLRSLGRRGSLGEWSAGQDWSQRHSFSKTFLIPVTTANRNIFPVWEEEEKEEGAGLGPCKTQNHKISNSVVYLVQLLFIWGRCATLNNKWKLQQPLWVLPFHTGFTWTLCYSLSLHTNTKKMFLWKE